ncbi:MAG: GTPase HflX [Acidobacteriota bacterium]
MTPLSPLPAPERAIVVAVETARERTEGFSAAESLEELAALAESAGAVVVEKILQARPSLDAATLVGSGKADEIRSLAEALSADLVVFDHELSGTMQRNLEKRLGVKVLDRTQLILDIFARRARTREGQLQVELAQLGYLLPRLTGRGVTLSRLGGGIGTRGPGETKLETDRRRIRARIKKIREELESVRRSRATQRRLRQAVPLATVALAGYTNAGKSTLFNRLCGASVTADARLFATLDPTVRHLVLPSNRRVLLSDTVGFIRQLPTTLVEAFRATLEEVTEASLLLHVVDASSPAAAEYCSHVRQVLGEIGALDTPQVLVLNKADLLGRAGIDGESLARRLSGEAGGAPAVVVSAATGEGIALLLETIDRCLPDDPLADVRLRVPMGELGVVHLLHEYGRVIAERYGEDACEVEARVPSSLLPRLAAYRA